MRSPLSGIQSPFGAAGRPSWLPAGAIWAYRGTDYWRNGSASLSALMAESRSGTALALMADGSYQSFGANTPIIRPVLGLDGYGSYKNSLLHTADPTQWTFFSTRFSSSAQQSDGGFILTAIGNHAADITNLSAQYPEGTGLTGDTTIIRQIEVAKTGTANTVRLGSTGDSASVFVRLSDGAVVRNGGSIRVEVVDTNDGYWRITSWRSDTSPGNSGAQASLGWGNYVSGASFANTDGLNVKVRNPLWSRFTSLGVIFKPPHIPTTTAAVTRPASNLTVIDPASLGITRPRFVADVNIDRLSASAARTLFAAGVDADNLIRVFLDTDNRIKARMRKSASDIWTLQSGVIGSTGIRRVEANFSPGANSLTVEGVTGDTNTDATALPTLTTWRLLNGLGGTTPWNGNVPLMALGEAA